MHAFSPFLKKKLSKNNTFLKFWWKNIWKCHKKVILTSIMSVKQPFPGHNTPHPSSDQAFSFKLRLILSLFLSIFSVMVRLNLTWRDRRLSYMNLREDFYQNLVNAEEKQKLWLPTVGKLSHQNTFKIILSFTWTHIFLGREQWL